MSEHTELNGATHDNDHVQKVSSKQSRFRKSTTIGFGLGQPKSGVTDLKSPIISAMSTHNNGIADGLSPILPMFVQMNVRWHGVDKSWREASR